MKIMVVGGTGLLGYHSIIAGLKKEHGFGALAIKDIDLSGWYPNQVFLEYGDVFAMSKDELIEVFTGYDALIYAVGPDDRVVPPAPAYDFFYERLVLACENVVTAAREAKLSRCVILGSYFAYFDRLWQNKQLAQKHPYIRCRVQQAQRAIAAGGKSLAVMVLELPYIFGSMPKRTPLWKNVLLERFAKGNTIYFPKGGTNMISAHHVGEAAIGAVENAVHGMRYPVGDENHTFDYMLNAMMSALGEEKKIVHIPRFLAALAGRSIERSERKKGLQGGLNPRYIMRDILTDYLYFDPAESAKTLGYGRGGLAEAIQDTVRACYPERFD